MAISEDTAALVAAQLTAAHCAISPMFGNSFSHRERATFVTSAYEAYKKHLQDGGVEHFSDHRRPSQDQDRPDE